MKIFEISELQRYFGAANVELCEFLSLARVLLLLHFPRFPFHDSTGFGMIESECLMSSCCNAMILQCVIHTCVTCSMFVSHITLHALFALFVIVAATAGPFAAGARRGIVFAVQWRLLYAPPAW